MATSPGNWHLSENDVFWCFPGQFVWCFFFLGGVMMFLFIRVGTKKCPPVSQRSDETLPCSADYPMIFRRGFQTSPRQRRAGCGEPVGSTWNGYQSHEGWVGWCSWVQIWWLMFFVDGFFWFLYADICGIYLYTYIYIYIFDIWFELSDFSDSEIGHVQKKKLYKSTTQQEFMRNKGPSFVVSFPMTPGGQLSQQSSPSFYLQGLAPTYKVGPCLQGWPLPTRLAPT